MYREVNIDSLIGPTHHYGGLAYGNEASMNSKNLMSNPKKAALQGLDKMALLEKLGVHQLIIPPQIRPDVMSLRDLFIDGICKDQSLLSSIYSSSYMWMANAGHFTPGCDSLDKQAHFTVSNFASQCHRQFEIKGHQDILTSLFNDQVLMHPPISSGFSDEGAANDIRLCSFDFKEAISLFVYGRNADDEITTFYPCRQTKEAYDVLCLTHRLQLDRVVFAKQHKEAINQGVFHNDVISVGHKNVFLCHEFAFENQDHVLEEVRGKFKKYVKEALYLHVIPNSIITLKECVKSYLFNSQLVDSNEGLVMIAPKQCEENSNIKIYIDTVLLKETPIKKCFYVDLQESMRNGGGPACLRLKVVLSNDEYKVILSKYQVTPKRLTEIKDIVSDLYPENVTVESFEDSVFLQNINDVQLAVLNYFRNIESS